jgi:hypothetical protein
MKLKDFDAYGGNIQACVQAMTKQRIADNDGENNAKKRYVITHFGYLSLIG